MALATGPSGIERISVLLEFERQSLSTESQLCALDVGFEPDGHAVLVAHGERRHALARCDTCLECHVSAREVGDVLQPLDRPLARDDGHTQVAQ